MSKIQRLLDLAHGAALTRIGWKTNGVTQNFRLGAAAERADGKLVVAVNGLALRPCWNCHAEARLCRKLTPDSVVAVVRVDGDGQWKLARPCESCQRCLKRSGVKRVFYSIAPNEYGTMLL